MSTIRHYSFDGLKTLCGRSVTIAMQMTRNPNDITCTVCKSSKHLDGALGNMTHTGH
jgi:hypothetical protein